MRLKAVILGRQGRGSRDGAVVRALASHQCGTGLIPGLDVKSGLSLLLVLLLAPKGFSPDSPGPGEERQCWESLLSRETTR